MAEVTGCKKTDFGPKGFSVWGVTRTASIWSFLLFRAPMQGVRGSSFQLSLDPGLMFGDVDVAPQTTSVPGATVSPISTAVRTVTETSLRSVGAATQISPTLQPSTPSKVRSDNAVIAAVISGIVCSVLAGLAALFRYCRRQTIKETSEPVSALFDSFRSESPDGQIEMDNWEEREHDQLSSSDIVPLMGSEQQTNEEEENSVYDDVDVLEALDASRYGLASVLSRSAGYSQANLPPASGYGQANLLSHSDESSDTELPPPDRVIAENIAPGEQTIVGSWIL